MSPLPFSTNSAFTDFLEEDNNSTDDEDASDRDYTDRMVKEIMVRKCKSVTTLPARRSIARTQKPPKKKRKQFSGAMMWTNPVNGISCRNGTIIMYRMLLEKILVSFSSFVDDFESPIHSLWSSQLSLKKERNSSNGEVDLQIALGHQRHLVRCFCWQCFGI